MSNLNNIATISGTILDSFQPDTEFSRGGHLCSVIAAARTSNVEDKIPVVVPAGLLDEERDYEGAYVEIKGEFRSRNKKGAGKSRLLLYFYVTELALSYQAPEDRNDITLDGFLCRIPIYRKTPMGREIGELLVAVNREGGSDYIPCITWGRNARYAATLTTGDHVRLDGRIQSREYNKHLDDGTVEVRTAYEVSVSRLEYILKDEDED